MKRKGTKVLLAALVLCIVAVLTACGGGSKSNEYVGTWYDISDPSESNPANFVFRDDGKVENEGVEGTYTVEDGTVTVNFFGSTETYYHTEFMGYDALFYEDEGVPFVAKSLEGAQDLYEEFYGENADDADEEDMDAAGEEEPEESGFMTEEEAFEQQGYFIMVGEGQFKPIGSDVYRWWDPIFLNLGAYVGEEALPVVSKSKEKIVYMSGTNSLSDGAYMPERKLLKKGYTIPACVKNVYSTDVEEEIASFKEEDIISINGDSLEQYLEDHSIANGTSWDPYEVYFDCEKDEEVTIKYRQGTEKLEWEAFAMTTYWLFDEGPEYAEESDYVSVKDGEGSYVELDLSDVKPGYYELDGTVIKLEK